MSDTENMVPWADWVLIEADRRFQWSDRRVKDLHGYYCDPEFIGFRALCDNIAKYEQPPVDRKVLCAQEAWRLYDPDTSSILSTSIRAIELWEEGFGA